MTWSDHAKLAELKDVRCLELECIVKFNIYEVVVCEDISWKVQRATAKYPPRTCPLPEPTPIHRASIFTIILAQFSHTSIEVKTFWMERYVTNAAQRRLGKKSNKIMKMQFYKWGKRFGQNGTILKKMKAGLICYKWAIQKRRAVHTEI